MLGELQTDRIKRPPYYSLDFFSIIREAEVGGEDTLSLTTRAWQKRIMERGVTHQRDVESGLPEIIHTGQEVKLRQANWVNIWSLRRKSGLTPAQKSWFFMWTEGLHVNNERLCKIGKTDTPTCDFCDQTDSRTHILNCNFNKRVCQGLQQVLQTSTGAPVSEVDLGVCDLSLPNSLQLPVLFMLCEVTKQLQLSRENKKPIELEKMNAELRAKAGAYLLAKKFGLAHSLVGLWMDAFFADERVLCGPRQGAAAAVRVPHGFNQPAMHRGVGE